MVTLFCRVISMQSSFLKMGLIGLCTGLVNGLLGIGGGTIAIPAMVFLLGVEQHKAHGTSLAIILPTSIISLYIYYRYNFLDWGLITKIVLSGMIGGYIGAKLMNHIPAGILRKIFGVFMALAGLRMVL